MTKASELRNQSIEELKSLYHDLSKQIYQFSNEIQITRKAEKPHLIRLNKRNRARVLTVLRQKDGSITN